MFWLRAVIQEWKIHYNDVVSIWKLKVVVSIWKLPSWQMYYVLRLPSLLLWLETTCLQSCFPWSQSEKRHEKNKHNKSPTRANTVSPEVISYDYQYAPLYLATELWTLGLTVILVWSLLRWRWLYLESGAITAPHRNISPQLYTSKVKSVHHLWRGTLHYLFVP